MRRPAGGRIGLVTGVHIAWAPRPAAETDGPVGTAVLARALTLLGGEPVVLTDTWCGPVVDACLATAGCAPAVVLPGTATEDDVRAAVAALGLGALVAVERLGPNRHGRVLTMRAVDITASTAPLHAAFDLPGLPTGAVGDGGNEIGMGDVPLDLVAGRRPARQPRSPAAPPSTTSSSPAPPTGAATAWSPRWPGPPATGPARWSRLLDPDAGHRPAGGGVGGRWHRRRDRGAGAVGGRRPGGRLRRPVRGLGVLARA